MLFLYLLSFSTANALSNIYLVETVDNSYRLFR